MRKGQKVTPEQRERMRLARQGVNAGMYGKHHTPETIEKRRISLLKRRRFFTEDGKLLT